jgi:lipopolysaccharide/colanic/teichoic acid biosynthesis glycosyltransferase
MSIESASTPGEQVWRRKIALACAAPDMPRTRAVWYLRCKRALDITAALVLSVAAVPVIVLVALAVRLTSRGPALYSQIRLGQGGRPFRIVKIRSMYHECERQSGARWSTPGDTRVTPLGRFLRASHLDELPQLWNVLVGHMSLIGPRPERPEFVPTLEAAIPHYRERLRVRPGVTGLAQVQLPPDTDLSSVRRKLACDLVYVERVSLWLDFRILLGTVFYIFRLPGVWLLGLPGVAAGQAALTTPPDGVLRPETRPDSVVRRALAAQAARPAP